MYEIELKAHVYKREETVSLLNSFAEYLGTTIKDDTYYHFQLQDSESRLTCRIRHELYTFPDSTTKTQDVLTYKAKERRTDKGGSTYEVNEENETTLSDPEALRKLLFATGYREAYTKHKDVMQWIYNTELGQAHIELCTVPPLGDFLEIEMITENCNNEETIRDKLKSLIVKSGVSLNDIEEKYYSELLKFAKGE